MKGRQGRPSAEIAAIGGEQPLILFFGRLAQVKGPGPAVARLCPDAAWHPCDRRHRL